MTDIECPQCGHRALRVATRCPGCGHEFSEEQLRHRPPMPGRRPFRRGRAVALVAVAIALAALVAREAVRPDPLAAPAPARDSLVAGADSGPAQAPAATPAPVVPAPAPAPEASPPPATPPARRYATDWVNVRESRGSRAPVVQVLEPGDTVLVDSLRRGWYRILADGRTLGYAHRRFFGTTPPGATP